MANEQKPNPADFEKNAALVAGVGVSQLRDALISFDTSVVASGAPATTPPQPPAPPALSGQDSSFSALPLSPLPLDSGYAQQIDGPSGSAYIQVTVTGVINGVAGYGTVPFVDGPTPL